MKILRRGSNPYDVRRLLGMAWLISVVFTACSHTSVQPTPELKIVITSAPDVLLIGETFTLAAANAATGEAINADWSSSNLSVASISRTTLTAVAAGRVNIVASFQGGKASY